MSAEEKIEMSGEDEKARISEPKQECALQNEPSFRSRLNDVLKCLFFGGSGMRIFNIIVMPLWISLIGVGAFHLENCRFNPLIPKWMIVFGGAYMLTVVLSFLTFAWDCLYSMDKKPEDRRYLNVFDGLIWLINLFIFAWLIVGSVWVLGFYSSWSDKGAQDCSADLEYPHCCERAVFLFSFAVIIFEWVVMFFGWTFYSVAGACGVLWFGASHVYDKDKRRRR